MAKETRNFVLVEGSKEVGIFTGRSPRQAALKAANRGIKNITLRERGTKKLHIFKGDRKKVKAPPNHPSWMPDEIWKPTVRKKGTEKIEK